MSIISGPAIDKSCDPKKSSPNLGLNSVLFGEDINQTLCFQRAYNLVIRIEVF